MILAKAVQLEKGPVNRICKKKNECFNYHCKLCALWEIL